MINSFDRFGRIAGQDGIGCGVGAGEKAIGTNDGVFGDGGAFENGATATNPHFVGYIHGLIFVDAYTLVVENSVRVRVGDEGVPADDAAADAYILITGYLSVARGRETFAKCEFGTRTHNKFGALTYLGSGVQVECGALRNTEDGVLGMLVEDMDSMESYMGDSWFDRANELYLSFHFAHSDIGGQKYRNTEGLTQREVAQIEVKAIGQRRQYSE